MMYIDRAAHRKLREDVVRFIRVRSSSRAWLQPASRRLTSPTILLDRHDLVPDLASLREQLLAVRDERAEVADDVVDVLEHAQRDVGDERKHERGHDARDPAEPHADDDRDGEVRQRIERERGEELHRRRHRAFALRESLREDADQAVRRIADDRADERERQHEHHAQQPPHGNARTQLMHFQLRAAQLRLELRDRLLQLLQPCGIVRAEVVIALDEPSAAARAPPRAAVRRSR